MSFQTSQTELKNFLPLSKLGQGTFSTVYKVKRIQDAKIYALKKIKMQKLNQKQKLNALNQIRILASIKSDFIISYKQAFYDQTLNLLCIIMEYAQNGDLQKSISDHLKAKTKFKEEQIWKAASQILIGLLILHQKDILHRDLKSANVFISNKNYKLGDLNVSKVCNEQMAKTQTGTPYYASPQVWRDEPYDGKCDIWSFGCLLYEMCCLEPPFQGRDLDELFKVVQKGKYRSIPSEYSVQMSKLIRLCLNVDPKQRFSASQLITQFPILNKKFTQSQRNHQNQSKYSLLNTIELPLNLKDLTKNLPLSDYHQSIKQLPKTNYHQTQNKQTMLLRDKNNVHNQKIAPLPERIKNYFKQQPIPLKKRPQRPHTSSKRSDKIDVKNQVRPVSAVHCAPYKLNNYPQKLPKKLRIDTQNKLQLIKAKYNFKKQKETSVQTPKGQKRIQSCSPKNRSYKNDFSMRPISRNNNRQEQQKIPKNYTQEPKLNDINSSLKQILPLHQKNYLQCKQNSIKRISSLEKKVQLIREERKQRKVIIQKNKQNSFSIKQNLLKDQNLDMKQRLKQKIKQNSQIFQLKKYQKLNQFGVPEFKSKNPLSNVNKQERNGYLRDIQRHLQNRQKNLYYGRNVVSAQSKRIRTDNSVIQKKSQKSSERSAGMIRKIPSNLLPSIGLDGKQLKKDFNSEVYCKQPNNKQNINESLNNYSMIDNSEAIIRLKKRIKNRIICQNSQQKHIEMRESLIRNIPINKYYY